MDENENETSAEAAVAAVDGATDVDVRAGGRVEEKVKAEEQGVLQGFYGESEAVVNFETKAYP